MKTANDRRPCRRARTVLLAACLSATVCASALAQGSAEDATEKLEKVRKDIEAVETRKETLQKAVGDLARETDALSQRLVTTAANIQASEAEITAGEDRLKALTGEEEEIRQGLSTRREQLANLLAGLQRLEQDPPPPLVVNPNDALAALRGAMLLGSVVPKVRAQSARLASKLRRLAAVRVSIQTEQAALTKKLSALDGQRREVAHLLEQKQTLTQTITEELEGEKKKVRQLAQKAKSLKDLLGRIEDARIAAEEARKQAEAAEEAEKQAEKERQRKLQMAKFMKPAMKFSKARGKLYYPAQGTVVRKFGDEDELGEESEGLSIATRQFAQITAPNDGWVAYAGEFRGYGQLLIINAGEGYHVLLAGMEKIVVEVGQFVRAGEPVGTMGVRAIQSAAIGVPDDSTKPILYVEFRKNGNAINSRPWWAGTDEKVRG